MTATVRLGKVIGAEAKNIEKNLSQINCLIAVNELLAKKYVKLGKYL